MSDRLASEYGLHPVYKKEFHQVFEEFHEQPEFAPLLQRMRVVDANGESQMDEDQWEAASTPISLHERCMRWRLIRYQISTLVSLLKNVERPFHDPVLRTSHVLDTPILLNEFPTLALL